MIRGITFSAFDLLHSGHIVMLEEAKRHCDYLIVGLHVNPAMERNHKNRPVQTVLERYLQLKGCKYVDEIITYETEEDLVNILKILKPDIRILGEEYRDNNFTGKGIVKEIFNTRNHNYSSTNLRERICKSQ